MKKALVIKISLATVFIAGMFCWNSLPVYAGEIGVSPARLALSADAGKQYTLQFKVINSTENAGLFQIELEPFTTNNENGIPVLDASINSDALTWLIYPTTTFSVAAGGTHMVQIVANIPADATPGSYQLLTLVKDVTGNLNNGNLAVVGRLGIITTIDVAGEVTYDAKLNKFSTAHPIYDLGEINFDLQIENKSGAAIVPRGAVDIYGNTGKTSFNFNDESNRVLANSTRNYVFTWKTGSDLTTYGPKEVEVVLAYGDNKVITAKTQVWVLPWRLLLGILITIPFLIIWFLLRRQMKKQKIVSFVN